ncbi:MAG: ATP-binding cassette domain-containing protein [Desulfobacterales bacterium]|nr:ATP-binding cassette domain-containing protein [Desulfobacterales bacterium]
MNKNETLKQQEKINIGGFKPENDFANCLIPLLDSLGWRGDHVHLVEAISSDEGMMTLQDMLNTMANLKFESKSISIRLNNIDDRLFPCLFVPNQGKAVVLIRKTGNGIFIFDGSTAKYSQLDETKQKGLAVLFQGMKNEIGSLLKPQAKWFSKVVRNFYSLIYLGISISLILSIIAFIFPLMVMKIYDQILLPDASKSIGYFAIGIVIFVICEIGFNFLRSNLFGYVSVRMSNVVGNEIFRRLMYLPAGFTESATLSSQVSRIKDFENVKSFLGGPAIISLFELPFIFLLVGGMIAIGGEVAYVPLCFIILFVVFGFIIYHFVKENTETTGKSSSAKQEFVIEMLSNIRAVKYLGIKKFCIKKYRTLSAEAAIDSFSSSGLTSFINSFSQFMVSAAGLATMTVGVYNVMNGKMMLGALMACMMLVWRVLAPLRSGFGVFTQLGKVQKSIMQINRLMNLPIEHKLESSMIIIKQFTGKIVFNQVSIRYSMDAHPALIGINFELIRGETLIVVGHDGAGKSTLLKLILGLYQPQAGRVLIDDMNVRQMDPIILRRSIGYAPQTGKLLYGTIAQNLRLAHPIASDEDLKTAAEKATILNDIMKLPDGFSTVIGIHNITQFTSGFIQGLNLARIFLKNSVIFLMDEPENGLNSQHEKLIIEGLKQYKEKSTMILATHSSNFFQIADKILWLEKGRMRMFGQAKQVLPKYLKAI